MCCCCLKKNYGKLKTKQKMNGQLQSYPFGRVAPSEGFCSDDCGSSKQPYLDKVLLLAHLMLTAPLKFHLFLLLPSYLPIRALIFPL